MKLNRATNFYNFLAATKQKHSFFHSDALQMKHLGQPEILKCKIQDFDEIDQTC